MNLEELQIEQYTASLNYEIDGVEFIMIFDWNFYDADPKTYDCKIDVYCTDAEQWINGIKHSYFPSVDEMKVIKTAIEDVVLESPVDWGLVEHLEMELDFYNEQKNENL